MEDKFFSPMQGIKSFPTSGGSGQGGDPTGPFASYRQSGSELPIVTRDTMPTPAQGTTGALVTPMDQTPSLGVSGSGGGMGGMNGEICSPMQPFIKKQVG